MARFAPYHFVPIKPLVTLLDKPVYHDRLELGDRYTGELRCTLRALTPLLAGNYQFDLGGPEDPATSSDRGIVASEEVRKAARKLVEKRFQGELPHQLSSDKKVIEPLIVPRQTGEHSSGPGPVLIPGSQLKGMVRQSLAALLNAPMERVWDRRFSYRPNLQIVRNEPLVRSVVGLVVGDGQADQNSPGTITVYVYELTDIIYVHPDVVEHPEFPKDIKRLVKEKRTNHATYSRRYVNPSALAANAVTNEKLKKISSYVRRSSGNILKLADNRRKSVTQPQSRPVFPTNTLYVPVVCFNGLDMLGELNRRFHEKNPDLANQLRTKSPKGYDIVFVPIEPKARITIDTSDPALKGFYDTLEVLTDFAHGHLRDHPLVDSKEERQTISQEIERFRKRKLQPGDLIFFEQYLPGSSKQDVRTLGHHYYYRVAYRDSIHTTKTPQDQVRLPDWVNAGSLRNILAPHPQEMECDETGRPGALSAARLLFGFVTTSDGKYQADQPLVFGVGHQLGSSHRDGQKRVRTDYAQLTGRIAINHAIEQDSEANLKDRFLNAEHECLVPLRPLGAPKPSAVEHYLTQDRLGQRSDGGILCTYGDTPDDNSAGQLRGRKFYLHQPDAAQDPKCYELIANDQPDWKSGNTFHLLGNQAPLARFVSRPGRSFRFTLRFFNLRAWELGAILFVLDPTVDRLQKLLNKLTGPAQNSLKTFLDKISSLPPNDEPLFAHKLGHGRPLGLGSVMIHVDQSECLQHVSEDLGHFDLTPFDTEKLVECFFDHLIESLSTNINTWVKETLIPWLAVHQYRGRSRFDYPRARTGSDEEANEKSIFAYHQKLRKKHAKGRKRKKQSTPLAQGLPSVDQLG